MDLQPEVAHAYDVVSFELFDEICMTLRAGGNAAQSVSGHAVGLAVAATIVVDTIAVVGSTDQLNSLVGL
jgi:hypothetical protein